MAQLAWASRAGDWRGKKQVLRCAREDKFVFVRNLTQNGRADLPAVSLLSKNSGALTYLY
jgi:hypothetical protein